MLKKIIKSRYFLLGFVPILSVYVFLGYYYSVGKLIKTDNAYIKAPIISVKSEIAGKVNQVFIKNNQFVYKNQKLINIDTKNLVIKLSENKETLNTILEELQIRKYKLNEIEAEIKISEEDIKFRNREEIRVNNLLKNKREIAKNDIKFYQLEFQRQLKLTKKGFGIKKELEEARYMLNRAKTNLLSLEFNKEIEETKFLKKISYKKLNLLYKKKETLLATLLGDKNIQIKKHPLYLKQMAIINSIKLKIKKSFLRADRDGFIANLNLESGEFINKGQPLFVIIDKKNIYVEANFKETQITNFKIGQKAKFVPDTFPDIKYEAIIESLSPATGSEFAILPSQNASGNWVKVVQRVPVRLQIKNYRNNNIEKLKVGMTLSVTVDTKYKKEIPLIFQPITNIFKLLNNL